MTFGQRQVSVCGGRVSASENFSERVQGERRDSL